MRSAPLKTRRLWCHFLVLICGLFVASETDADVNTFANWQLSAFEADAGNSSISGPAANPAGDGVANLMKYALGLNPFTPGPAGQPVVAVQNGYLTLTYTKLKSAKDIRYQAISSGDLSAWSNTGVTESILSDNGTTQQVAAMVPLSAETRKFIKLSVALPPSLSSTTSLIASDGFTDGDRTNGTDALGCAWYTMGSPTAAIVNDTVIGAGNALKLTTSAASQGMVANLPSPVTLAEGDSVALSFSCRFTGTANLNGNTLLRFGLYNSNGTLTGTDGTSPGARADDVGYCGYTNPGLMSGTSTMVTRKSSWGELTQALTPFGNTGYSINSGTTAHNTTLTILRAGSNLVVSASIDGQRAATGIDSAPLTYTFDEFAFSISGTSISPFILDNMQVNAVPLAARAQSAPVGCWRLNEGTGTTTSDSSGNGITGTLVNSPTWTTGMLNNALTFNGTSNYVRLSNGASTGPLKPALPITVCAWVKLSGTNGIQRVFSADNSDNDYRIYPYNIYGYDLSINSGHVSCDYGEGKGSGSGHCRSKSGTAVLSPGAWYHVAAVIQGPTNMQLYVNGVDDGGAYGGIGGTMAYSSASSKIGTSSSINFFYGSIDDVRVYNKALDPSAINLLAADVGQWSFDEGTGSTAADSSGDGINGTLVNSPAWIPGRLGNALSFNGTSNYVNLNNGSTTGPLKSALPVTITGWVMLSDTTANQTVFASDEWDSTKNAGYVLQAGGSGISCSYGSGGAAGFGSSRTKTGTTPLTAGVWNHVAAVISGSTTMSLYLNGVDDGGTYSGTGGPMACTAAPSKIGYSDAYLHGFLDEVGVYDEALTPAQIAAMAGWGTLSPAYATQYIKTISSARTSHCVNMDIVGNTLYLCAAWSGLGIYDITNRANPVEITTISDATKLNALSGVRVFGNYAFVACEQSNSLTVVNLVQRTVAAFLQPWVPADPPATGNVGQLAGACSLVLNNAGTIAYISTITRQNLALIDISVPTAPKMISEVRSSGGFTMAGCRDVVINEAAGVAYVASEYSNNIVVIDISVPTAPFIVTTVANPGNNTQRGLTLNTAMNRLYVVGTGAGKGCMDIWDVSNPRAPVFVKGLYGSTTYNFYSARGVVNCGNYVYLCSEYGNIFIVADITNELAPVFISADTGPTSTTLAEALWMRVQDGYAYIAQFGAESGSSTAGNALSVIKINPPYPTAAGK